MSAVPTTPSAAKPGVSDVSVVINGTAWKGWQSVRITRGCERMPADFQLSVTEKYPGSASEIDIQPFQPCVVRIGSDTVITGYVDRYVGTIEGDNHTVEIIGRSKSQDLVDCSAVLPMMAISNVNAVALGNQLGKDYGITVSALGAPPSQVLPKFNVTLGETPYEILERVARYCQVLLYDGTDGNVILAQVGSVTAASGFVQGVNVERASVTFRGDERFSVYMCSTVNTAFLSDQGDAKYFLPSVPDTTVPRLRRKLIVSEQTINGKSLAEARASWEMARRIGRSQAVTLTCDSWRDAAGALWAPNTLAPVTLPALKLVNKKWVISEVTYAKDDRGTRAEVTLMPPSAFQPQPDPLQPFDWQVSRAIAQSGAGKP
jgi:prophage tail gpP-like protein